MPDDFSESGMKNALDSTETVNPGDLDVAAAMVRAHLDFLTIDSSCPSSLLFSGLSRHSDHQGSTLRGRLWDVSGACRQLARRSADASLCVIASPDPSPGQAGFYEQPALIFGASSTVPSSTWAAGALAIVLVCLFLVSATNFYDDFTVVEFEGLTRSAFDVVSAVFDLLGWLTNDLLDFSEALDRLVQYLT